MKQVIEVAPIDAQRLGVAESHDRRGARAVVEQRQLAEKVTVSRRFEDDAAAGVVLEKDLHLAVADDEQRIAGVAVAEDCLPRLEADDVELGGEDVALLVVEKLEEGDFGQKRGLRALGRGVHTWHFTSGSSRAAIGNAGARPSKLLKRSSTISTMTRERLQKVVARAGIASRRAAEELILKGRVRVNGTTVDDARHQGRPARRQGRGRRPPARR